MGLNTLYGSIFAERFGSPVKGCLPSLDKGCLLDGLEKGCFGSAKLVKSGIDSNSSGETRRRDVL